MKTFLIPFLAVFWALSANAQGPYKTRYLTAQDIDQLKEAKALLGSVDAKPLQETIDELEKARYPQLNVQMKEAMARAYADLVLENRVTGRKNKEWLYSMVCLNMAYLQFGGGKDASGGTSSLNALIRKKLREHLSADILKKISVLYTLG